MARFLFSGTCHGLCCVGKFLLVHLAPVMFAPLIWLLLMPASILSLAWFLHDVKVFWDSVNEPFPDPASVARAMSDATQRERQVADVLIRRGIRVNAQ